jgi:hypothetical protein
VLLKLRYDVTLSNFAFKFNLRRYDVANPNDISTTFDTIGGLGKAMHVQPMEPNLKAPGTKRWNLKRDKPLSNSICMSYILSLTTRNPKINAPFRPPVGAHLKRT